MLAVLSGPGTTPPEPRLYFTLSASPCHALPALLAREPPTAAPGPGVGRPGIGDGGDNYQDYAVCPQVFGRQPELWGGLLLRMPATSVTSTATRA
jgi:hypothetical protein